MKENKFLYRYGRVLNLLATNAYILLHFLITLHCIGVFKSRYLYQISVSISFNKYYQH